MEKTIKINFNDQIMVLPDSISLEAFLNQHHKNQMGCAVAVNQIIVPRDRWGDYQLKNGDQILLFQAIAGG